MEQLGARAAARCRDGFVITADQGFVLEAVVVRIESELRHLVRRAAARVRVVRRGDRRVRVPAADEIDDGPDLALVRWGRLMAITAIAIDM